METDLAPTARIIDSGAEQYRVLRLLGAGSFAETFACERVSDGKIVAIKELRVKTAGSWKPIELFAREVKVLAALKHPSIPALYESFESKAADSSPTLCLAQELVEGDALLKRILVGPLLGEADVYAIALALLDTLEYLHTRLPPVFHRDLKPSNVIIRTDGTPALVDFGGVCFGWRPPDYTGTTVVGTFGYMPPEQLMGQVDARADLYALGATLLHAVTGTPPHEFSFETGRIEVGDDLPVRPELRRLIRALLCAAPRDRPATAATARALLTTAAPPTTRALVPTHDRALARRDHDHIVAIGGVDAPGWVDVGPAPRDPQGEFKDVYRLLIDPWNWMPRAQSTIGKIGAGFAYGLISLATFGVIPLVQVVTRSTRTKQYRALFTDGEQAEGYILSASYNPGEWYASFAYEYVVGEQRYRALMEYPPALRKYLLEGTRLAVLHDPQDPSRSCFVYRKVK